jgi:BCD family chlorophyll transporter-like MFS transporter
MVGMVMGAGLIKSALKVYAPDKLVTTALGVAVAVFVLAVLGALGQEKRAPAALAAEKARTTSFAQAFRKVVLGDPQVRMFFVIVILTFMGTLAQDVLLEPFGGLVLGMQVGETTGLTQFWGVGVLLSMLASGLFLLKALGHVRVMRAGMLLSVLAFSGPIMAGATGNVGLFQSAVFVMGLGTGLAGAGMLSGTLAFTTRLRAGMLVGVWGVANMVGHAGGSLLGGVIVDSVRLLTGSPLAAYSSVFALEMALLLVAFGLSLRLNFGESAAHEEEQLSLAAAD